MTHYDFGDVVLLAFPFTNLAGAKQRPAFVLADTGDHDILVARITSDNPRDSSDYNLIHWKDYGLLLPSVLRTSKTATLDKKVIVKKMGKVGSPERRKIKSLLKKLFDLS